MANLLLSLVTLLKYCAPSINSEDLSVLDSSLKRKLSPLHHHISRCTDPADLATLGDQLPILLTEFLEENRELFADEKKQHSKGFISHPNKTLTELQHLKKVLRKKAFSRAGTDEDRKKFHSCLKAISELRKGEKRRLLLKTTTHQEKMFHKNRWDFSKQAVKGSLLQEKLKPTFDLGFANTYYPEKYSTPGNIDLNSLNWFPFVSVTHESPNFEPFNCEPLRPKDVKNILKNANLKSSPGPDGIQYEILFKFNCLHHILATLYNKVNVMGSPPPSWSHSVVKLLHKKGSTNDPGNFRMISLTSSIAKTYHLLLAKRLTKFLTVNNYIDEKVQKAFLPGINGTIEHNVVLDEIISQAKTNKKTVHVTFFDLEDAFGSVPHPLIIHTLKRFHVPAEIQLYINTLYNNQLSRVFTDSFSTDGFPFKRGVFQGDPLSPIIFLMVFNPIIELLQSKNDCGFNLNGEKIITLPYADDFCLITTDLRKHQKIQNEIKSKIESMGMRLKPAKCRSFSIRSGVPSRINFTIGETEIPNIFQEEQKFLGKLLFPTGRLSDAFDYIKSEFETKLVNINALLIRDEYKVWIYKHYFIPSIRFLLTVHTISQSHLKKLDTFTDKFVKKWTGLPPCATNAALHLKPALDITSISTLYKTTMTQAYTRIRILGDETVNSALQSKLDRKKNWLRKNSVTDYAEKMFHQATLENYGQADMPEWDDQVSKHQCYKKMKTTVSEKVSFENETYWREHTETLIKQGHFLCLAMLEKSDMIWKSYMFNLKKGTLKFLLNSCLDTLPTQTNLLQWGKSASDLCKLCLQAGAELQGRRQETTNHILNGCKVALHQKRYTWRHNNLIKYITGLIDIDRFLMYADIPSKTLPGGGTVPPHLLVTAQKPDLVIMDRIEEKMDIFELTVPLETNIKNANTQKMNKYEHFITDITTRDVSVHPFEIGSRGYISPSNKANLKKLHKFCKPSVSFKAMCENLSSLAVLSSYHIFRKRKTLDWDQETPFLKTTSE